MRSMKWQAGVAGTIFGVALALGVSGCKSNANQPSVVDANNGPDPATANEAPVSGDTGTATSSSATTSSPATSQPTRVLGTSARAPQYSSGEDYQDSYQDTGYDQSEADAGQAALYADQAPPPMPEYQQPELTEPGYLWTPGYWDYGTGGYYWVPGAWVAPPYQGALWTPGYWGYYGHRYGFHRGFWARHIGFYGGINYGFGYVGTGYEGGYWNNNQFYYNNNVNRVNVNVVHTVYVRNVTVINNNTRISFNGPGGIRVAPRPQELAVLHEQRTPPMQVQVQRVQAAAQNRQQFYAENHGKPAVVAAPEHFTADRTPPAPIRQGAPVQAERGGFGQPAASNQRQVQAQQQQMAQQQRAQELNAQHNTQVQQQQQAREQQQQRTQQLNAQHNTQVQQQQQAREQQQQRTRQQTRVQPQRPVQEARPAPQAHPEATAPRPEAAAPRPEPQQARSPQAAPRQAPSAARPAAAASRPAEHPAPHAEEKPKR